MYLRLAGDVAVGAVAPDRGQGGGFGLFLLETVAQRWGSNHDGSTCVWAELAIAPATWRSTPMSTLKELQGDVALRMRRGDTFAVETQAIDASVLSDTEKVALWLYGWSFVNSRRRRREAVARIDVLAATPRSAKPPDRRLRLV
jgi:hypothetical protein